MIGIAMMAGVFVSAQYGGYSPPSTGSYQNDSGQGLNTAPYVQLERKCFDKAITETQGAALDVRQQRYDACLAIHDAMVKHATARLSPKEAAAAKRDLDRALREVEKSFAKQMGVAIAKDTK